MIRKYRAEDVDKVLDIWLRASVQSHSFVKEEYWQKMVPVIKKYYLPNTDSFVFEDKHKIKAFMSIIDDKHIGALFVDPVYQNQKIGTKLVNYAKKIYPELTLKVYIKNLEATRFYQSSDLCLKQISELPVKNVLDMQEHLKDRCLYLCR